MKAIIEFFKAITTFEYDAYAWSNANPEINETAMKYIY